MAIVPNDTSPSDTRFLYYALLGTDFADVTTGTAHVFNVGSTGVIGTIEFEPGLRRDLPETDNKEWLKNIIVSNKAGKVSLEAKPVVTTSRIKLPERTKIPYMVPTWKYEKRH